MPNDSTPVTEATELRSTIGHGVAGAVALEPGTILAGRFEIGELLGEGGMGSVFAARDTITRDDIAIKVLLPEFAASEHARQRFVAEVVAARKLTHPKIVRVYDVGVSGRHLYFTMERLRGETLRERLKAQGSRQMPLATLTDIARQMIEALQYAQHLIVHRDIKPENTWLGKDGGVKLMDFGIARTLGEDPVNTGLTQTGMNFGTEAYMAPEQRYSAKHVDWRADQYSIGVVLYELLTGALPIGVNKPLESLRPDLPTRYARAVMRALSANPQDRWPSWQELSVELALPNRTPPPWVVAIGTAVVVSAGAGLYVFELGSETLQVSAPSALPPVQQPSVAAAPANRDAAGADADQQRAAAKASSEPAPRSSSVEPPYVAQAQDRFPDRWQRPAPVTVIPKADPLRPLTQPAYPPGSREAGEEGTVKLDIYVLEDGRVGEVRLRPAGSSGFPALDAAAMNEARRSWRLVPGTRDGKPVAMWVPFAVTFKLSDPQ